MQTCDSDGEFRLFAAELRQSLLRAFVVFVPADDLCDVVAECLAYAWENWDRVRGMQNPQGYLFRVGQSKSRRYRRRRALLPDPGAVGLPDFEPRLIPALRLLSSQQRAVVWLVYACEWRHSEVAAALGISPSAVSTHASRGMGRLRSILGEHHGE